MAIPYLFRCPISLDLFKDPVTLSTGQTYERSSIEKWLATGNLTCPVTMQKLQDLSLVPNHTLTHLIDQWLQMGQQCGQDRARATLTDPDRLLAALKHTLESNDYNFGDKLEAFEKIEVLCRDFPLKIPCLIQMEILSSLITLVFERRYEKSEFVEHALCCVLKLLPYGEMVCLNVLLEKHNFASFLALFKQGSFKIKARLCQLVEAISSSLETRELCSKLGQNREFLRTIIQSISGPDPNTNNADIGIKTVSALSVLGSNRDSLVRDGAIDGLIAYIMYASPHTGCVSDGTDQNRNFLKTRAMAALEVLLGGASGKEALLNNPSGVKALVKMVFRVSDHDQGSESAVNALMIVCEDSLKAREDGVCAGVLTQLLLLIQSQCNVRVKTKARMLLKLLRSMWIENPKHVL